MNCRLVQSRISAFVDRELDQAETKAIQAHLDQCAGCAAVLADSLRTKRLLGALPASRPKGDFEDRLITAVRQEATKVRLQQPGWLPIRFGWVTAAVAAAAAVAAVVMFRPTGSPESGSVAASASDLPDGMERDQFYYQANNPLSNGIPVSLEGRHRR
jgi:anti-sigma factor RsiW